MEVKVGYRGFMGVVKGLPGCGFRAPKAWRPSRLGLQGLGFKVHWVQGYPLATRSLSNCAFMTPTPPREDR